MKLADKPCYPNSIYTANGQEGLTFRERLIVALASNAGTIINSVAYHQEIAENIIKQADAIIKQLEEEKK